MSNARIGFLRSAVKALTATFDGSGPDLPVTQFMAGRLPARLYRPQQDSDGPPILFFHGGGFVSCDFDTHDALCRRLSASSGRRVVAIAYRLAPEHPAPSQLDDAVEACRWALGGPAILGPNTSSIIVAGDSAGGYLAARCGMAINAQGQGIIAQVLFYPLVSLDSERELAPRSFVSRRVHKNAVAFIRKHLGAIGYPSLLSCDVANLPTTIIIGGRAFDPVHDATKSLVTALRASDVPVEHIILPRLFHGALNAERLSRTARQAVEEAARAIRQLAS